MALENKEPMQKYFEASSGCLQNTILPGNLHYNGRYIYGILGGNDKLDAYSKGANLDARKFPHALHLVPEEAYKSPMQGQESEIWAGCYPEFLNTQDYSKAAEAHYRSINKYRSYFDYQLQCPYWSHGYLPDSQMQEFQYFVVIDFEATCEKDKKPHPQEIIEFPSVLVNSLTGELEDCFQIYVRPTHNQRLSDFCKELTGIQQIQVDKGVLLSDALLMHDKWLEAKGIKQTKFAIVTWSNWDCRVMLESECRFKKLRKPPYFNRWINLKVPFYKAFGSVNCNLKEAVQMAGLVWEGRAHCGLDDARNTARLLAHLLRWGFKLTITNSLTFPCPDDSIPAINQPVTPCIDFQSMRNDPPKDGQMYCYCGVKSCKQMVRKPGPKHGCFFFGCGNWSASRGAVCPYFVWATS